MFSVNSVAKIMNTVIVANGELEKSNRLQKIWRAADLRIAADGGALNARKHLALAPHILIGDLDSLDDATHLWCEFSRVETIQRPRAKDETDLELAIDLAIARGASDITILGALGGRFDHTIANALLLVKPAIAHIPARIAGADFDAWIATDRTSIAGKIGETVSLIPLTAQVEGIETSGLQFALRNETLYFGSSRGVSNALIAEQAKVSFSNGILLIIYLHNEELVDRKKKVDRL